MTYKLPLLVCCCVLMLGVPVRAQMPVALPGTQQFDLVSDVNGQQYRLSVALPDGYAADDTTRYPVLYLLDGHFAFPAAYSARALMDLTGEVEDVILVGIGDGEHALGPWFVNRFRDYTPSASPAADSSTAAQYGLPLQAVRSGGGGDFLRVMREEIIPYVDATYRTSDDRGLLGHSLGGLFATYVLFEAPELFQRVGINSPSLWWNGGEMFEMEASFAEEHDALPAHVFLSVGSEEGRSMVPPMEQLAEALRSRGYEGLTVEAVVFENETHTSVGPAMLSRTLRVLYPSQD